jgi:flagellar basal body P-ring protein FlgI
MEYLFLKVRTVSVGETSKVSTQCDGDDCDGRVELLVNLEEIDVIGTEVDPKIMINDEVGVILSPPNVANIGNLEGTDDDALEIIQRSIVSVFDQESSYEASEMSNKDMKEFIESLTFKQLELLTNYFEELPKLSHTVVGTCNKCSEVTSRTLEGLNSFF